MIELYNNKNAFLFIKPLNLIYILILITLIFNLIIYFSFKTYVYDTYLTKALVTCEDTCLIKTAIPSNITNFTARINNKMVDYQIIEEQIEVDEPNFISYKILTIKLANNFKDQEIVDITFYYNQQRIIRKIYDKIFS